MLDRNVESQTSERFGAFKVFSVAFTTLHHSIIATRLPVIKTTRFRSRALWRKTMHFSDISTILSTFSSPSAVTTVNFHTGQFFLRCD